MTNNKTTPTDTQTQKGAEAAELRGLVVKGIRAQLRAKGVNIPKRVNELLALFKHGHLTENELAVLLNDRISKP